MAGRSSYDLSAGEAPSYLGMASCAMFLIATAVLAGFVIANWQAAHKMAGLELVVIGPFALLLYVLGVAFAVVGGRSRDRNRFSRLGLVMNSMPLILVVLRLCYLAVRFVWL